LNWRDQRINFRNKSEEKTEFLTVWKKKERTSEEGEHQGLGRVER
jgi:hypothetical protein